MTRQPMLIVLAAALLSWSGAPTETLAETEASNAAPQGGSTFLVSPLAGWNRNELTMPGPGGVTSTLKDTGAEYGLFLLYAGPRVAANNMTFTTEENGAKVMGDIFFLNLYGDPSATLTWNAGGGYTWHSIDVGAEDIRVSSTMAKAGIMIRWPAAHLSFNPYLAEAWETVNTTHGDSSADSLLYGLTAKWQWRMIQATARYYYQDDLDSAAHFDCYQARVSVFFTRQWGLLARFDHTENSAFTDTSFTFGPAYVF